MTKLPPCHSRRELEPASEREFLCVHPRVHASDNIVTPEICRMCKHWKQPPPATFRKPGRRRRRGRGRQEPCFFLGEQTGWELCESCRGSVRLKVFQCYHPDHDKTTITACEQCQHFEPGLGAGHSLAPQQKPTTWAIAVTTAPRFKPTLARCLNSLAAAGWSEPHVFAEPDVELPSEFAQLRCTLRDATLGAWPNWYMALAQLVIEHPLADAYLMVQDDTIFCKNVRPYVEQNLWPAGPVGAVSLYCPTCYRFESSGLHAVNEGGGLVGALAFIFPNAAARLLLADLSVVNFRRLGPHRGLANVDGVVGDWARRAALPVHFYSPSLGQHIGDTSTPWQSGSAQGRHCARSFLGEDFDALSLLAPTTDTQ